MQLVVGGSSIQTRCIWCQRFWPFCIYKAAQGTINGKKKQAKFHSKLPGCCCSVTQSRPILHEPMDCSTPGFPVLHHLLEFDQTHVH